MSNMTPHRAAYTLREFAQLFSRERSWAYRLASAGKIRIITGYGKAMVPQSEVDRILAEGGARG